MKNILIISSSYRLQGNSDLLADAFMKGAQANGNIVEKILLNDKQIQFCRGCLACQKSGKCIIQDDAIEIVEKMKNVDVIVFATPIYFYSMCGQLKTLLDRSNPAFISDYKFRDIYLLTSAADEDQDCFVGTKQGLEGWISCFEKTQLKGIVSATGVTNVNDIKNKSAILQEAYTLGHQID